MKSLVIIDSNGHARHVSTWRALVHIAGHAMRGRGGGLEVRPHSVLERPVSPEMQQKLDATWQVADRAAAKMTRRVSDIPLQ